MSSSMCHQAFYLTNQLDRLWFNQLMCRQLIASLGYPTHEVNEPLLEGQLGYNPTYREPAYNLSAAENTLSQAGWNPGPGGIRTNGSQQLSFSLTVSNTPEYLSVANQLKNYWAKLGVNVTLYVEDPKRL